MLRATRWGLSLAVDPYGRTRAWHSAFERGSGIMFAELPRSRVRTLYSIWGDAPVAVAVALLAGLIATKLSRDSS
jgi:apolipoprotein N-acyltransferase